MLTVTTLVHFVLLFLAYSVLGAAIVFGMMFAFELLFDLLEMLS